ncbi:uncharacterized protein LOC120350229 [Nilaparvata lugens]|uniref:uncharacterized protein LOC120350229 n=1 Tax=Nilaparvata lugens TaxID=108931 RepID=UPI00193D2598|nr:uncharacterized protein LOC120350229 [Nilaparvata lugens]
MQGEENDERKKQAKRKLVFGDEPEVSGEEEEESICSQTKKRAVMDKDSSLVPLMKEVEGAGELDFVQLINKPLPKPWIPLRELKEDLAYHIIGAREETNKHGRCTFPQHSFSKQNDFTLITASLIVRFSADFGHFTSIRLSPPTSPSGEAAKKSCSLSTSKPEG